MTNLVLSHLAAKFARPRGFLNLTIQSQGLHELKNQQFFYYHISQVNLSLEVQCKYLDQVVSILHTLKMCYK